MTIIMAQYFLQGAGRDERYNLHSGLNTVGRNPTNDVRLLQASVSSFHSEIEVEADRVILRDLQSTNGTHLNCQPVTEAEIRPGDELVFGEQRLRLDCEAPVVSVAEPVAVPGSAAGLESVRYLCTRCGKLWAAEHVKLLKLGQDVAEVRFCPGCSGRCVEADPVATAGRATSEPSLLGRLSQTIQINQRRWSGKL